MRYRVIRFIKRITSNFYIISVVSFLAIPVILIILLLSPYFFPQISHIYFLLKPIGMQVFNEKQTMWSYVGVLSAGVGIFLGFLSISYQKKIIYENLVLSLIREILRNIDQIFTGEVERVFSFDVFERIQKDFPDRIKNEKEFEKIRCLYDDLYYYREMVKIWRVTNPADIITERQLGVCNSFLDYFGEEKIDTTKHSSSITFQMLRNDAIKIKDENIKKWKRKLILNIHKAFDN